MPSETSTVPEDPSEFEGTVYHSSREWAFKICRSGYDELVQQDGFATRLDAQAECQRQLASYDPKAKVINQYRFVASLELTVEGDTLEQAEAAANEEFLHIFETLDTEWWARGGAGRYGMTLVRERYEE